MRRSLPAAAVLAIAFAASHVLIERQGGDIALQGTYNRDFADEPSLQAALDAYPKRWPPLYPTVLWAGDRVGLKKRHTQELLLDASIVLLWICGRRIAGPAPVAAVVLLYAFGHFNYSNLRQYTAETLVVPLGLLALLALDRYRRDRGLVSLLGLALVGAALNLSRYFSLPFLTPVVGLVVLATARLDLGRRLAHFALYLAIAGLPVGLWMARSYAETGFLTGIDRSAPRVLPPSAQHWNETTTLLHNVLFSIKTLRVDFFSPSAYASHRIVDNAYPFSAAETLLGLLALGALATAAYGLRGLLAAAELRERVARAFARSPGFLAAELAAAYLLVLVTIWTVGNNDPIYTRFLFPTYALLLLALLWLYELLRHHAAMWTRWPCLALYAGTLAVQLVRDYRGVVVPLR